jgi:glycosyltransferase involved in cell wall biosynthesis
MDNIAHIFDLPGSLFFLVLLFTFFLSVIIQLIFYWFIFSKLAFYKKREIQNTGLLPVSVIICAHNEAHNLKKNLPLVLEQDHPDFEVVLVDDNSDDDTFFLLKDLSMKYPHLKVVKKEASVNFFKGKKFALAVGIKSAKNEILVLTDADCYPQSDQWLKKMQLSFTSNKEIVIGYGPYEKGRGLLNLIIRYDTLMTAVYYLSFALMKMPYMGVGRNLAYTKSLFYRNKGFTSHYKIQSGDDDLFINQCSNKNNTAVQLDSDAQTISFPKKSFKRWFLQKKRHYSTGRYYKFKHKLLLTLFPLCQFVYFGLLTILLIWQVNIEIVLGLVFIKIFSRLFILKKCMNILNEKKLLLISLFIELFFVIFNPVLHLSNIIRKQNKWKK